MSMALFCGLEGAPTFLVPIINPPFADNSPHLPSRVENGNEREKKPDRPIRKNL
jgi:hypothetical protein